MFRELEQNKNGKWNQGPACDLNFNHPRRGSPQEPSEVSSARRESQESPGFLPPVKETMPPPLPPTFSTATFADLETSLSTVTVDGGGLGQSATYPRPPQ